MGQTLQALLIFDTCYIITQCHIISYGIIFIQVMHVVQIIVFE